MLQTLRQAGDSLVMTVPKTFFEQNQLQAGSEVQLFLEGVCMTVSAKRKPHYKLKDLLAEMTDKLPEVEDWDEMKTVGREAF